MSLRACMGGWRCPRRERCGHYHAERRWMPAERLCVPGEFDQWAPLGMPTAATTTASPCASTSQAQEITP